MNPKYSKNYGRELASKFDGISYVGYMAEEDAYYFQSGNSLDGYFEYRLLEDDMTEESAKFLFDNGLTNTNKSKNL